MAEELISSPLLNARGSDYCATPDSWEMRPEAQTPAQHRPNLTSADKEVRTPHCGKDGVLDSFNGFMDYDMYETPPGAHLFRDQCAYDSFDISYQDMDTSGKVESCPYDMSCDRINSEVYPVPEYSPLDANKEEGCAVNKESSLLQNEQNHEVAVNAEVQDSPHYIDSTDKCDKFGDSDLHRSFDTNGTDSQQNVGHEVEECILEQLDQQEYHQEGKSEHISPIAVPSLCHLPLDNKLFTSPRVESVQELEQHVGDISQAVTDYESAEEVGCTSEKTEHCEDYLNTSALYAGKESEMKDGSVAFQEEMEVQPQTSSAPPPPEHINSSLLSMGAPQDAHELDQLADFLNMEDPFKKPVESPKYLSPDNSCTSQFKDTDYEEPGRIPIAEEKTASPSMPPKRKKRVKKVNTVSERRRSVRIARRESLLNTSSDIGNVHLQTETSNDISNTVPLYDQNNTQEPVIIGLKEDHRDQSRIGYESECVPHPFPEVGKSSPEKFTSPSNEIRTMESGLMEDHTLLMAPSEAEDFEHLNIDLPMSRKKRKTHNGRRRSVRLLKQDIRLHVDEGNPAFVQKPGVDEKKTMCDSGFLADFADCGLGDNWMPGDMFSESQFAKTPKEKSGRRKSARLSGVPVPLLELTNKSEVKVFGGVEESSYRDGSNVADYHLVEDSQVPDTALTALAETTAMNNVSRDVQGSGYERIESLTEFPFERQDTVQSSKKKKESCSKRRRSVRLIKKPQEEPKYDTDPQQEDHKLEPLKKAAKSKKKKKSVSGFQQDNVLQEINITNCDNVSKAPQVEREAFTILKAPVDDPPISLGDQNEFGDSADFIDFKESIAKATSCISKDTPLMGRKRVSRITEKDKENDDAQAQEQCLPKSRNTAGVDRKQKKRIPTEENDDTAETEVSEQQPLQQAEDEGTEDSVDNFQVTNKIKLMYLKKGSALKKHNLETIFESPKKRATGTPVNLLGGRRLKRSVAFAETPWLGRTGRTKGRKVKKGKQVKRVLSSKVEKSWKLDIRLSSLDDPSP